MKTKTHTTTKNSKQTLKKVDYIIHPDEKSKEYVKKLFYSRDLLSSQIALKTKIHISVVRDIIIEELIYKKSNNNGIAYES